MKMKYLIVGVALALVAPFARGVSPEDLINAVDAMTPEQVQLFQQKLEARFWEPVPEGFFTRMGVDVAATVSTPDKANLSSVSLSGGPMDLDTVAGASFGLLWRVTNERLRLGLRVDQGVAMDSNLTDAGYSRVTLNTGTMSLAVNVQCLRTDRWLLWTEVAPGFGYVEVETVNTPTGQPTTIRSLDQAFSHVDLVAGVSWRMNPVLSLFLSGGYRVAESVDLDEGGRSTPVAFDASGFTGRLGLGINL